MSLTCALPLVIPNKLVLSSSAISLRFHTPNSIGIGLNLMAERGIPPSTD
jgi:hypothetical protein